MASKTTVVVLDDLDGSEGASTIRFALEGTSYEIDLSDKNAEALREALSTYVDAARKVGGSRSAATRSTPNRNNKDELAAIRAWANENGHQVSERGRIANSVVEAYRAANA